MANQEVQQSLNAELRSFYGYRIVSSGFLILFFMGGALWTFGVFLKPLLKEFGLTRAAIAGAFSLQQILQGVFLLVSGRLNDRFGPRIILSFAGFFLGLSLLLMSQVKVIWHIYLFYGILAGIGIGCGYVPVFSTVARWFFKRRALMTGIASTGGAIGIMVISPAAAWSISNYGWRTSYMALGFIALVVTVIVAQFLKRDPSLMGQFPDGEKTVQQAPQLEVEGFTTKEAMCTKQFWLFNAAYILFAVCLSSILVHIVAHAIGLGISAVAAASLLSVVGAAGTVGKLLLGSIGDRLGNKLILITALILMTAALAWLLIAKELWMLYVFVVLFGLAYGGMVMIQSPSVAWLFGLRSHGAIMGLSSLLATIGNVIGPALAGYMFDTTGRYQMAFLLCAAFSGGGLILTSVLIPPKR